jgi:hypothetical protein
MTDRSPSSDRLPSPMSDLRDRLMGLTAGGGACMAVKAGSAEYSVPAEIIVHGPCTSSMPDFMIWENAVLIHSTQ